ncbi:MAG: hypothetical protein Q8P20_10330 [bacterium]|nr:hypothetical protein [bacterium]
MKKLKKNIVITQAEHDQWHKKNKGYDSKNNKEHDLCHKEMGIVVKKSKSKT